MPDNGALAKCECALNNLLTFGANAGESDGVLTCMRLPHESGKVPVSLLFRNAMELSYSNDRRASNKDKDVCRTCIVYGASVSCKSNAVS